MTKLQQQLAEQFLHILEEEKLDWKKRMERTFRKTL